MRHKVLVVFGTRPEAIKMAPVVMHLQKSLVCDPVDCVTAQHRDMLDRVLEWLKIMQGYDLDNMFKGQALFDVTFGDLGISQSYPRCEIR